MYYHIPGFTPGATYYWRVDEIEKDGVTTYAGDVWSFVAQDVKAYYPSPVDAAKGASAKPTLTWMAGAGALKHHLYFGDNLDAVTQGTVAVDKGVLAAGEATFAPGALENLTTYYWRVDEVLTGDTVKAGPVWSFTTCLPVDDFDSYTDDVAAKTTIFDTWIDGYTNSTGSIVGNAQAPFAEQTIVHGGTQSMPLDYNNVATPFYSEAEREFAPAQDWTVDGANTLILYVRGRVGNGPGPLYVTLEDSAQHTATVVHADAAVLTTAKWTQWRIPLVETQNLASLQGVSLAKVKKLSLGVGDKANPKAGGRGLIYLDDIGLARP